MNNILEHLKSQRHFYIDSSLSPEQSAEFLRSKLYYSEFSFVGGRNDLRFRLSYDSVGFISSFAPDIRVKVREKEYGSRIDIVIDLPLLTKVFMAFWETPFVLMTFFLALDSIILGISPMLFVVIAFAVTGYAFTTVIFNISAIPAQETLMDMFRNENA